MPDSHACPLGARAACCAHFPAVPSLRQLLVRHRLCLVIDTCTTRAEATLWRSAACETGLPPALATAAIDGEASSALLAAVAQVLASAGGLRIRDLDAVAFCDGPGSVLGIRLAAATLRAWRAVHPALAIYAFHSLPLLAVASAKTGVATIIADARRDTWHAARSTAPHTLLRIPTTDLATCGTLATPDNFRRWSALPADLVPKTLAYSASALLADAPDEAFFSAVSEPDAFLHEQPNYVTWTPRIHQAPGTTAHP